MCNGKRNLNLVEKVPDERGQVLIETLLIMIVSLGLLMATLNYFKDTKTLDKITNTVWTGVAQMTEFGNWPTAHPPVHPNSSDRVRLVDPRNP